MSTCRVTINDLRTHGVSLLKKIDRKMAVSENDFHAISNAIFDAYIEQLVIAKENSNVLFSVGLIEISFVQVLIQAVHSELNTQEEIRCLSKKKINMKVNSSFNKAIIEASQYYDILFEKPRLKRMIRRLTKFVLFNKFHCLFYNKENKSDKVLCLGSRSALRDDYINKQKICCHYFDWEDFVNINREEDCNRTAVDARMFQDVIIKPFLRSIEIKMKTVFHLMDQKQLLKLWGKRVQDVLAIYHNVDFRGASKLLVTEAAKPIHKIIIRAFEDNNIDSFIFHHGYDTALTIQRISHVHNILHCKNIVVPTSGIVRQYTKSYENFVLDRVVKPIYHCVENRKKQNHKLEKYKTRSKPIVMVVGYPYNERRYTDERGLYFIIRAKIESKILDYLKKLNVVPVYKVHPDRKLEACDIMRDYSEFFSFGKFEDECCKADVIIFTYVSTTTFGYSLKTNKKIILIEDIENNKDYQQWEILRNRVHTVDARIDEYGEYHFSIDKIRNLIFSKNSEIDYAYLDEYFNGDYVC